MAYQLVGQPAIDRNSFTGGDYTEIVNEGPSAGRGILKLWDVYIQGGTANVKVKIFRDDGTNYLFIGEGPSVSVVVGLNSNLKAWIPVEKGDLIGIYLNGNNLEGTSLTGSTRYIAGDITTDTLKTSWTNVIRRSSLEGKIFTRVAPF